MYVLSKNDYIISDYYEPRLLVRDQIDWENFSEADLTAHLNNVHNILTKRLFDLANDRQILTERQEKELQFMLEAFVQVKRLLQENK